MNVVQKGTSKKYKSAFLNQLYSILQSGNYGTVICWSDDGEYFKILNPAVFAEDMLPRFYKHSKYSSFIRQLNIYGFRKTNKEYQDCKDCYMHPHFQRGRADLLKNISRSLGLSAKLIPTSSTSDDLIEELQKRKQILTNEGSPRRTDSSGFESQLHMMNENVHHIMGIVSRLSARTEQRGANEEYLSFKAELFKVLEFEKIDQE